MFPSASIIEESTVNETSLIVGAPSCCKKDSFRVLKKRYSNPFATQSFTNWPVSSKSKAVLTNWGMYCSALFRLSISSKTLSSTKRRFFCNELVCSFSNVLFGISNLKMSLISSALLLRSLGLEGNGKTTSLVK